MTGSAALDILIGLFTLYFVMSTLSSAFVEIIANVLALRSKMLKSFLEFQFYRVVYQKQGNIWQRFLSIFRGGIKGTFIQFWQQDSYQLNPENT